MAATQLFVGRLPRNTRSRDMEDIFYRYGKMTRCDIKQGLKMAYGFIEYEDKRDAEDAIRGEHGRDFMGTKIVVEWARGPRDRFEPKEKDVRKRGGGDDFHRRDDDLNRRDDDYPKRGGGDDFHKREYGNGSYDRRSHSRSPVRYREPPRVAVGPRSISPDRRRGEEDFKRQSGRGEVGKAQGMRGGVAARAA
ncbi:hypothetical protein EMCRGX_G025211 [Ephydatia muelleri]